MVDLFLHGLFTNIDNPIRRDMYRLTVDLTPYLKSDPRTKDEPEPEEGLPDGDSLVDTPGGRRRRRPRRPVRSPLLVRGTPETSARLSSVLDQLSLLSHQLSVNLAQAEEDDDSDYQDLKQADSANRQLSFDQDMKKAADGDMQLSSDQDLKQAADAKWQLSSDQDLKKAAAANRQLSDKENLEPCWSSKPTEGLSQNLSLRRKIFNNKNKNRHN